MSRKFSGTWRNPNFLKLWVGETASLFGSQITILALPLVAANDLQASPSQMGALGFTQYLPRLLEGFGLILSDLWVPLSPLPQIREIDVIPAELAIAEI